MFSYVFSDLVLKMMQKSAKGHLSPRFQTPAWFTTLNTAHIILLCTVKKQQISVWAIAVYAHTKHHSWMTVQCLVML